MVELLTSLFTADELRRFAAFLPDDNLMAALPSGTASLETLAFEMVHALDRRGQLGEVFFARLEEERPGRKAEIIRVRSRILGSNAAPAQASVPAVEDLSAYLPAYAAWARRTFEHLPMRGLGGMRLDLRLEDVYVPLELMPRERSMFEAGIYDDETLALHESARTVRLEEAFGLAGPGRHLFVRGDPGTGKTTALTRMLWSLLNSEAETGFDGRSLGLTADTVPVLLRLSSLAGPALGREFEDVLDDALVEMTRSPRRDDATGPEPGPSAVPPGFGRWLWQRGQVLLLLDGLDEIANPQTRARLCRYIEDVLDQTGPERVRAVVSSRFASIQEEDVVTLDHRRFLHLDVRHLDDAQIADLVERWFAAAEAALSRLRGEGTEARYQAEARTVLELLGSDAYASRQLKELVSTPLFLTLLCVVVFQGGQIPERRAEFFRECLRVLLVPWARRKGEQRLSLDESLDLLQHIAWHLHRSQRRDDLGEPELRRLLERPLRRIERHRERKLNVSSVIDWFRRTTGVLTEYATVPVEYGFLHLSLQEYLAARYAATYPTEGIDGLATHFGSSWWREVALLFVALPEYRHFAPLMEQVIARGKLASERQDIYQCLLEAHVRDLTPFLDLIEDRGAPIEQRVEALRLVRDQDDEELISLASEIALEPPTADGGEYGAWLELRRLAEHVEAHASRMAEERRLNASAVDVLLICAAEDEMQAQDTKRHMQGWGWSVAMATSLRSEDEPWIKARAFVPLVGPDGRGAWQNEASRKCLVEMVRREAPVVSALLGNAEVGMLPPFLETRPHTSLSVGLLQSRLPAMLAEMLDVTVPAAAATDVVARSVVMEANAERSALDEEMLGTAATGAVPVIEAPTPPRAIWTPKGLSIKDFLAELRQFKPEHRRGDRLRPGDELGDRYLLVEQIGRGDFATVWRARDSAGGDEVAIKVLHPETAGDLIRRQRFFRGARIMAELDHPTVVRIREREAEDDGFFYFVMDYMPGGNLRDAVLAGRVQGEQVVPLILQIGEALAAAHTRGHVHRDVKPANILLTASGEPRLTDFDLVTAQDTTGGTRTGALGTFLYAPPEMMERPQEADARADVYGLGMTLAFVLHGDKLPRQVLTARERFIEKLDCTPALKAVLQQATAEEPEDRYPDATALCEALRKAASHAQDSSRRRAAAPSCHQLQPVTSHARASGAIAEEAEGQSFVEPTTGIRFLWVPGGTFWMGSGDEDGEARDSERPRHQVQISAYWLAETPVTNRQYEGFLRAFRHEEPHYWRERRFNQPEQPVVGVSWLEAKAFCRWLSDVSGHSIDLPTEAQWEFAARGECGWTYPWGDDEPDESRAWFGKDLFVNAPLAVGSLPDGRGPYGHLDLAGNVSEWCQDAWDAEAYPRRGGLTIDPVGPSAAGDDPDIVRACRGAAFVSGPTSLRCAFRGRHRADVWNVQLSFRVAAFPASR